MKKQKKQKQKKKVKIEKLKDEKGITFIHLGIKDDHTRSIHCIVREIK